MPNTGETMQDIYLWAILLIMTELMLKAVWNTFQPSPAKPCSSVDSKQDLRTQGH